MLIIDNRIPLPPHVKKVLKTMFAAYSRLVVKHEFSEGFSGSRVFLVRPIREDGHPELPSIVKVDYFDRIEKEWQAYQKCIHNRLPSVAKISGQPVYPPGSQHDGLRYPLAGDDAFDVVSLQDYCQQAAIDDISYVLGRLFASLGKLWEQKKTQPDLHLHTAYDSFLPPNLVLDCTAVPHNTNAPYLRPETLQPQTQSFATGDIIQLSDFQVIRILRDRNTLVLDVPSHLPGAYRLLAQSVPNIADYEVGQIIHRPLLGEVKQTRAGMLHELAVQALGPGVDVTAVTLPLPNNVTLPNPLIALPRLLNQSFDVHTACIHADLHLGNVLVEPESGNVHLIDFVNAREDHVLRDFLNLELSIVNRLLPAAFDKAGLSFKQVIPFYERLHCALHQSGQISPPEGLERPFAILLAIRQAAARYLFKPGEWEEYYDGLVIYLMGSLRYGDLDQIPGAKQTAFWGAATVLNLAETEVPCDEFLDDNQPEVNSTPADAPEHKSEEKDRVTVTQVDNRSGGVYFGGGNVEIGGDVVGGNQTKTQFHGSVSGPIHTGSGDINITNRQDKLGDRPGFMHLRLDTAVPGKVYHAQPFDVAVAIRQSTSPVLTVNELNQVESGVLRTLWSPDASSIRLRVAINAPDCDIQGPDSYTLQLYQEQDSRIFFFKLIPRNLGEISLIFTVYQEAFWVGSARMQTIVQDKIVGSVQTKVSSYAIKQRGLLRQILTEHFNDGELHNLSFDLGVDYETLPGQTKQDKARELITHLERRDRISELVQACYELRPHAPWWSTLDKIWETPPP
jgi:hypothetical protein